MLPSIQIGVKAKGNVTRYGQEQVRTAQLRRQAKEQRSVNGH
jgi:hypothetical protein